MKTLQDLAKEALAVQDACNLSGVVHSFASAMTSIWEHARMLGLGTTWVNTHPICVMYSSKIASLTGSYDHETFSKAYAAVEGM